jgi:hypothetical protein
MQVCTAPITGTVERHLDFVPVRSRTAVIPPAGIETVAHVIEQTFVAEGIRVVFLRIAEQMVSHLCCIPG